MCQFQHYFYKFLDIWLYVHYFSNSTLFHFGSPSQMSHTYIYIMSRIPFHTWWCFLNVLLWNESIDTLCVTLNPLKLSASLSSTTFYTIGVKYPHNCWITTLSSYLGFFWASMQCTCRTVLLMPLEISNVPFLFIKSLVFESAFEVEV